MQDKDNSLSARLAIFLMIFLIVACIKGCSNIQEKKEEKEQMERDRENGFTYIYEDVPIDVEGHTVHFKVKKKVYLSSSESS